MGNASVDFMALISIAAFEVILSQFAVRAQNLKGLLSEIEVFEQ